MTEEGRRRSDALLPAVSDGAEVVGMGKTGLRQGGGPLVGGSAAREASWRRQRHGSAGVRRHAHGHIDDEEES